MKKYFKYLKYVVRHKWYVMLECFKKGLYWRGVMHDMSKLLPSEFIPYAIFFYAKPRRDSTGYYKPTDTGDKAFDYAWLLHQKRNKHHWQWWVLPEDDGGVKRLSMPRKYVWEMICDWVGAGKAQGVHSPKDDKYFETRNWYSKNKDKMHLNEYTRIWIEEIIGYKAAKTAKSR